jgi:hypothetical protein
VGGAVTFALTYAATIGINYGVCGSGATWEGCDSKANSLIPVFGPFFFIGTSNTEGSYKALITLLGLGQVAGATMFISGFAFPVKEEDSNAMRIVPVVSASGAGAVAVGRF